VDLGHGAAKGAVVSDARVWRFGVVGTGAMSATMMECFSLDSRVAVVAVASADPARARVFAAQFAIAHPCKDLAALLARADIDAVYIATTTRDHAAHAIAALEAGKAVLCEKPFAISAEQGMRVAAAAAGSGKLFMEAQWTPALPAYRELQRLARERALGDPVLLHSEFGIALDPSSYARLFEGEGAGVLLDFGVYPIVLALQLMGPVRSVQAALARNAAGVDIQASIQLAHVDGGHSQLAASLVATLPNRTSLSCSRGLVELDSPVMGAESLCSRISAPARAASPSTSSLGLKTRVVAALRQQRWARWLKASLSGSTSCTRPYGRNRYSPQLAHFVSLLDRGARASDLMPIETSLEVLRVVDAARLAASPVALG
jgi:predicted dehydrogenase